MKAIIENLELNLESVTETAITQAATIKELKAQLEQLQAANAKLTQDLAYESGMKKLYMNAYNK